MLKLYTNQNQIVPNEVSLPRVHQPPSAARAVANLYGVQSHIWRTEPGIDYQPQGWLYLVALWAVSLVALCTNSLRALGRQWTVARHHSFVQILWQMGRNPQHISSPLVDGLSRFNHAAKTGAASERALALFYHYPESIKPLLTNDWEGRLTRFWIERMHNRQAVALRLQIATALLTDALNAYRHEPVIRIVSIATGSTEAVVQAIVASGLRNVEVTVLDNSTSALDAMRTLVTSVGLEGYFTFVQGTTRRLDVLCVGKPPHIIEMIGFLDYRPDAKAIQLIRNIYDGLAPGGTFFTGNIHPNPERIFLDWVLLWPMIYRTADQLVNLLISGEFAAHRIQLHYEPFAIHAIAVCHKEQQYR